MDFMFHMAGSGSKLDVISAIFCAIKFRMPDQIPADELLSFFSDIEAGTIRLIAEFDPQDVYAGNVTYRASNGWTLTVFNDANEFDYVDEVRSHDGRVTDFDAIDGTAADWAPDNEIAWRCLGIPGYCSFRCTVCGASLPNAIEQKRAVVPPFLCGGGRCIGQNTAANGTWIDVLSTTSIDIPDKKPT